MKANRDISQVCIYKNIVWIPILGGFVAALGVALPTLLSGNDFGAFIFSMLTLLGVTLAVVLAAIILWRQWKAAVLLLVAYTSFLTFFDKCAYPFHDYARWAFEGSRYKCLVLHEKKVQGQLQHVEWDGWGGPGAGDTSVYLVFDPTDSLAKAAHTHSEGKFLGIPCGVSRIRRFGNQWYEVTTFTDTDWEHCD